MKIQNAIRTFSTVLGLFTLISCSSSAVNTVTPSPTATPVTAQAVLSQAADQFGQVNTLHFELQLNNKVPLDQKGQIKLSGATGDLKRPSSAQTKAKVTFIGANLSINMISVDNQQYITNPVSGNWEKAPSDLSFDPAVLFDQNQGIAHVLRQVQDPTIVGTETVDGKETYHITGTVNKQDVEPISGGAIAANSIPVDAWVVKDTHNIVKLVLHDKGTNGGNSETTWTLLLSQQNQPVTIEKPNL